MYRMYGTVNQGFRNANSLAFRLMNAICSANGKMQVRGTQYVVPSTWYPVRGGDSRDRELIMKVRES